MEPPKISISEHLYVIDGGLLLHKVVWKGCDFVHQIFHRILGYITNHFKSRIHVVFDGYPDDNLAGTKSAERLRRSFKHLSPTIEFDENNSLSLAQEKFLSNDSNKARFIDLLVGFLRRNNITSEKAFEDADTIIVDTAIANSGKYQTIFIVGEDVDLLVLSTDLGKILNNLFLQKPAKGKKEEEFYLSHSLNYRTHVADHILLLHAQIFSKVIGRIKRRSRTAKNKFS